jgi:hypothetical protein
MAIAVAVGVNLAGNGAPSSAAPQLIAAMPLLCYVFFRRRAESLMPKVRDWMTERSGLVNILVCLFLVLLVLF